MLKPEFLHTPPLYEESTATVSWENTADADTYELDVVFNETFDEASTGKSWQAIDGNNWNWADQTEANGASWEQISTLPAQGLMWRNLEFLDRTWGEWDADPQATWEWMEKHAPTFTVYKGPGDDVPAPDQGWGWNTIEVVPWQWSDQDGPGALSWKEISLLPSKGLNFQQHDSNQFSWAQFEANYDSWLAFETQVTRGLKWESLDAKRLDWAGIESFGANGDGLTWYEWEHLPPDNQTHKGCEIEIPLYSKWSMLRVRAYKGDEYSDYLTTALIPIIPIFYRDFNGDFSLENGSKFAVQLHAGNIYGKTDQVVMKLNYDSAAMRIESSIFENPTGKIDGSTAQPGNVQETSRSTGQISFKCSKQIANTQKWSGLVAYMPFTALTTATKTLILS